MGRSSVWPDTWMCLSFIRARTAPTRESTSAPCCGDRRVADVEEDLVHHVDLDAPLLLREAHVPLLDLRLHLLLELVEVTAERRELLVLRLHVLGELVLRGERVALLSASTWASRASAARRSDRERASSRRASRSCQWSQPAPPAPAEERHEEQHPRRSARAWRVLLGEKVLGADVEQLLLVEPLHASSSWEVGAIFHPRSLPSKRRGAPRAHMSGRLDRPIAPAPGPAPRSPSLERMAFWTGRHEPDPGERIPMSLMKREHATTEGGDGDLLLGEGAEFDGKLTFKGTVRIDARFKGSIVTDDVLVVGAHARIDADITCGTIIVHGEVNGNIRASAAVELRAPARVRGDIEAPSIAVEKGVVVDGLVKMKPADGVALKPVAAQARAAVP